ncbi:MAG: hypothetical protein GHCLOJNM_03674 [bacterium]|nr:hypothetical protein [bacterium]
MNRPFDAVAFMRRRREEIDREDEGLTWEEKSRRTIALLGEDPLWTRFEGRVVSPDPLPTGPIPSNSRRDAL